MYEIVRYNDKFEIYELRDNNTDSWIKVCPERGGIIVGYGYEGKELLYMDSDTFYDEKTNIRGGIPILFPICGQLENGTYRVGEKTYKMSNHGVARILPWKVVEINTENQASITIMLESSEETKKMYPYDFELIFTYVLKDGMLNIIQKYTNKSDTEMPIYAGFHPYFYSKKKNIKYITDADEYFDINDSKVKKYEGNIDLTSMKESVVFLGAEKKNISFDLEDQSLRVNLQYGDEFKYIILWTVENKDFVCVEPWMAMGNSFNTLKDIQWIQKDNSLKSFFNIEVSKRSF